MVRIKDKACACLWHLLMAFAIVSRIFENARNVKYIKIILALFLLYFCLRRTLYPFCFMLPATWVARAKFCSLLVLERPERGFYSWQEILVRYILGVFAFLIVLFIYENVMAILSPGPRRLSLTDDYLIKDPPKCDKFYPFHYNTPMTLYEYFKLALFTLSGVLLLRIVVAFLTIVIGLACVAVMGKRNRVFHPHWFSFWLHVVNFFASVALSALGFYNIRVYGKLASCYECKLLIGNHSCVLEVMLFTLLAKFPSFVSRRENQNCFFSVIVQVCNPILVDRGSATSRKEALDSISIRANDPLGSQLMIFPEGTTANQLALMRFQKGAFVSGNPVQMFCIYFPYRHFNLAWGGKKVGGNDLHQMFLRLCCQFVNHAEIRVLPVYYPTEAEKSDAVLYADHCQKMMATVLGEYVSDATFMDYDGAARLYSEKRKGNKMF